jgi:hypothetical protein
MRNVKSPGLPGLSLMRTWTRQGYLAAQVIRVSTTFGTRKSITEPPRFLPMASMSPPLNFTAAIPIKKGVAAIIAVLLLHLIWSDTVHGVCESLAGI